MKICLVADFLPGYHKIWGGSEVVCLSLAEMLKKNGHNVLFLTSEFDKKRGSDNNIFQIPAPLDKVSKIFPHFIFFSTNLPLDIYSIFYSIFLLKKIKPDIVHFHCRKLFLPLMIASIFLRIPTVFSVLEYFILCPKIISLKSDGKICKKFQGPDCAECILKGKSDFFLKKAVKKPTMKIFSFLRPRIFKYFVKKLSAVIALTKTSKNRLEKYGLPKEKIKVIYQYKIDFKNELADFTPPTPKEPLILFVGSTYDAHKGLDILIRAMPDVISKIPDAKLTVIGKTCNKLYEIKIKNLINNLELKKNIEFIGRKKNKEVLKMVLKSRLVVVPEQWLNDFGPVILLEAMALGKPVVAGKIGGIPEFVKDGYNGFLVEYNQPKQFAEKIIRLLKNKDSANLMGKRAKESARFLFDKNQIKEILKLYNELITKNQEAKKLKS